MAELTEVRSEMAAVYADDSQVRDLLSAILMKHANGETLPEEIVALAQAIDENRYDNEISQGVEHALNLQLAPDETALTERTPA